MKMYITQKHLNFSRVIGKKLLKCLFAHPHLVYAPEVNDVMTFPLSVSVSSVNEKKVATRKYDVDINYHFPFIRFNAL